MFFLVNEQTKGKIHLCKEVVFFGTSSESDIKINSPTETEFFIKIKENVISFCKISGNILLNNRPFSKKRLVKGDKITVGEETFLFDEDNIENFLYEYLFIQDKNKKGSDELSERDIFIKKLIDINAFAQQISSILDINILLHVILESFIKILNSQKGFLLLYDTDKNLNLKVLIECEKEFENIEEFNKEILEKFQKIERKGFIFSTSLKNFSQELLTIELRDKENILGYICLISMTNISDFDEKDKHIIEALLNYSVIAIKNSNLYENAKYESKLNIRNQLQRHISRKIISDIAKNKIDIPMGGVSQESTILLINISNFPNILKTLSPKQVIEFLKEYNTSISKIIFSHNGTIDKFIGDGVTAIFGLPITSQNHAIEAILSSLKIQEQAIALKEIFKEKFAITDFFIKTTINTGNVVWGNIGFNDILDFRIIGDDFDTTTHIHSVIPSGKVLITNNTYEKIKHQIKSEVLGDITIDDLKISLHTVLEVLDNENLDSDNLSENSIRMYARVPTKIFVYFSQNSVRGHGLIRDISVGGINIMTANEYNVDEEIVMNFNLDNKRIFKNIKGLIKHVKKFELGTINKSSFVMGIQFLDLPSEKFVQISEYITKQNKGVMIEN